MKEADSANRLCQKKLRGWSTPNKTSIVSAPVFSWHPSLFRHTCVSVANIHPKGKAAWIPAKSKREDDSRLSSPQVVSGDPSETKAKRFPIENVGNDEEERIFGVRIWCQA